MIWVRMMCIAVNYLNCTYIYITIIATRYDMIRFPVFVRTTLYADRHIWEKIEFPEGGTVPPARDCHGAVLYKHEMYITAGGTGFVWLDDMFAYNLITKTWRRVDCTGDRPSGRAGHSANVHGDKMFVFAGWNGRRTLNDMHVFDFGTCAVYIWCLMSPCSLGVYVSVCLSVCCALTISVLLPVCISRVALYRSSDQPLGEGRVHRHAHPRVSRFPCCCRRQRKPVHRGWR